MPFQILDFIFYLKTSDVLIVPVLFLFACFSLKPCMHHTQYWCAPQFSSFCICALYLTSPCRDCIVNCCKSTFENDCWLWYWSAIFLLWAPCLFIYICIEAFTQRCPMLSALTLTLFRLWNLFRRRPRFSFPDLHADTRRVKLIKCCPPMKTSITQHHCDSSVPQKVKYCSSKMRK